MSEVIEELIDFPYKVINHHIDNSYSINYRSGIILMIKIHRKINSYQLALGFYTNEYDITKNVARQFRKAVEKEVFSVTRKVMNEEDNLQWVEYKLILKDLKNIYELIKIFDSYFLMCKISK